MSARRLDGTRLTIDLAAPLATPAGMGEARAVIPERGFIGDLKWALGVLAGMAAAVLLLGLDVSFLLVPAVVAALVVAVLAMRRHRRRARH